MEILGNIKTLRGPILLHIVTQKGKGYSESENDPCGMHAMSKIDATVKPEKKSELAISSPPIPSPTYSQVFGDWLCDIAEQDPMVVAVTPAMGEGSGMQKFAEQYPDRFHDVAIAEQHALTFAAGMACDGLKPVVAIYSTFLQRAYDQFIHDIALQNLNILFAIDRAGLVGEDGPTHAGSFDLSFMRCIPNLIIMAPSDEEETHKLLNTGFQYEGPAAVRYPRGKGPGKPVEKTLEALPLGKAKLRRKGRSVAILAFGSMVAPAMKAAEALDAAVADMRFVKPLDEEMIAELADAHQLIVTIEENVIMGGAGSAVNEFLARNNYRIPVLNLGLPDRFLDHGKAAQMLADVDLDSDGIVLSIKEKLKLCKIQSKAV